MFNILNQLYFCYIFQQWYYVFRLSHNSFFLNERFLQSRIINCPQASSMFKHIIMLFFRKTKKQVNGLVPKSSSYSMFFSGNQGQKLNVWENVVKALLSIAKNITSINGRVTNEIYLSSCKMTPCASVLWSFRFSFLNLNLKF